MSRPIEDYGYISNAITGALIATDGSIDWLCLPRFDGGACFAALLGEAEHGYWQIAPVEEIRRTSRCYRPGTAILETTFETDSGRVTLIDFMPFSDSDDEIDLVRLVRADEGSVRMRTDLCIRFDYGRIIPWVRRHDYGISAIAGPDALEIHTPVELRGEDFHTVGEFNAGENAIVPFTLSYHPAHRVGRWHPERSAYVQEDYPALLARTADLWSDWIGRCRFERNRDHPWFQAVARSLITLKGLTHNPGGGIVAAPTTSLPEDIGGVRNWDYRFCWIRDATLTLGSLIRCGYREEARTWRHWLLRAVAGDPRQLQIMYGISGERRLTELELPWLPGYENSTPVRIGNAAHCQRQLDVPGALMDALHVARRHHIEPDDQAWQLQKTILKQLEHDWDQPDEGIWEVRGGQRHWTHSRLMCWVAFDRAVKGVESFGLSGPVERWREIRQQIRDDICRNGWSERKRSFVQSYGDEALDASLLLMAEMGFLEPDDERYRGTVEAIERELLVDGLVLRYRTEETPDGLPGEEGVFLACSFWLVDAYVHLGRHQDAVALFERLLTLRNDLGLLAEEYDPRSRRQLGNYPQAFSHIALINAANNLASTQDNVDWHLGPSDARASESGSPDDEPSRDEFDGTAAPR